jgi:DNA-binding NarL/FixJ family response regulator
MKKEIKIAVVDDHKAVRGSLKTILEMKHFKVVIEADNGRSLLEQLNGPSEIPHICILDVNMPEMNGFDTAKALKKDWKTI